MPTVLKLGPYRFYFYSHESREPPHIHVDRDDLSANFWVQPIELARNHGFAKHVVRELEKIIEDNQTINLEAWNEHLGTQG